MSRREDLSEFSTAKSFWEDCHSDSAQEDLSWYLTGSEPDQELNNLLVSSYLNTPQKILLVGVGKGLTTQYLAKAGHSVDVLDISQNAINKVKNITQRQFTPETFGEMPQRHYDLALSHLVAQHMNDSDLELQMHYIFKGLKPGGMFAVQFTSLLVPEERYALRVAKPTDCMEGSVKRSLGHFEQLVIRAGGDIQLIYRQATYPNNNLIWYIAHINPYIKSN